MVQVVVEQVFQIALLDQDNQEHQEQLIQVEVEVEEIVQELVHQVEMEDLV